MIFLFFQYFDDDDGDDDSGGQPPRANFLGGGHGRRHGGEGDELEHENKTIAGNKLTARQTCAFYIQALRISDLSALSTTGLHENPTVAK